MVWYTHQRLVCIQLKAHLCPLFSMALTFLQVLLRSDHETELSIASISTSDGKEVLDHQNLLKLDMAAS